MEFTSSDFDSSSRAWLANKKRVGHTYKYKCAVEDCKILVKTNLNCTKHQGQGITLSSIPSKPELPILQ